MKLNNNAAATYAKELTITAMEHSMIRASVDPQETAKNVTDFFLCVADTLAGENKQ